MVSEATTDSLVGKFFHVLYDEEYRVNKQGVVEADYGFALRVRYFEWLSGRPAWWWNLVPLEAVATDRWCWYDSAEEMNEAYQYAGFKRDLPQ